MAKKEPNPAAAIIALVLAWLVPGAGHMFLGRRLRGIVILLTIGATFWGGVAMGGVMTVDRRSAPWWYYGEMLTGVHGLAGWYRSWQAEGEALHEYIRQNLPGAERGDGELPYGQKLTDDQRDQALQNAGIALNDSPTDNIARAYSGVAGMLNLLCMFDALILGLMGVSGEPKPQPPAGAAAPSRGEGTA